MQLEVGAVFEGKVTGITNFGAFVELPEGKSGMVHISEVADVYVNDIHEFVKEGQTVKVKIISIGDNGKISLSMKKAEPRQPAAGHPQGAHRGPGAGHPQGDRPFQRHNDGAPGGGPGAGRPAQSRPRPAKVPQKPVFTGDPNVDWTPTKSGNAAFEDMMQKYKQTSEEKISTLKRAGSSRKGSSRRGK